MADIVNKQISRRSFLGLFGASAVTLGLGLVGCGATGEKGGAATAGSSAAAASIDKITMVWLPNVRRSRSTTPIWPTSRSSAACATS